MKKAALAALLFAGATAAFASEEKSTYIISLNPSARVVRAGATQITALKNLDVAIADLSREEMLELKRSGLVRYIESDQPVKAFGNAVNAQALNTTHAGESHQKTPYGITMLRAADVWPVAVGAPKIKVVVIDTGIAMTHPDLVANYKGGFDYVNDDNDPTDDAGHGTHVAGTIAAADNLIGVVGVAPNSVELYAVKVLDGSGNGKISYVLKAIDWAIENKMNVVNLSLGGGDSPGLEAAFQKLADSNILAVAASGNSYDENPFDGLSFPAGYPTVLSVGAVDKDRKIGDFSQRGAGLSVTAPGVGVVSTYLIGSSTVATVSTGSKTYTGREASGSSPDAVSGSYVFGGLGTPEDIPVSASGKIVVVRRGTYSFWEKVQNAKNKGAIGVVIINNVPGALALIPNLIVAPGEPNYAPVRPGDPTYPTDPSYRWLPTQIITQEDGNELLGNPALVLSLKVEPNDYTEFEGTSMASPHVAGLAALVWSLNPTATAAQIRSAIEQSANDAGNYGYDTVFGNGIVDALSAARQIAPQKFPAAPPRNRGVRRN